jgi:hypothetical protein
MLISGPTQKAIAYKEESRMVMTRSSQTYHHLYSCKSLELEFLRIKSIFKTTADLVLGGLR